MSTPVSNRSSRSSSRRIKRRSQRSLAIVCGILVTLTIGAFVLVKGSVHGTEFAPSHFQTREFSFYEIPGLHLQITPIDRKNTTGPVASQLRTSGWIKPPRGKPPSVWHPTEISRGPSKTPLVASLLTSAMEITSDGNHFWVQWNKDYPNRASVLWPIVQKLAQRELYVLVPELLELARALPGTDQAKPLADAIDGWLVGQYVELIRDMKEAGRKDLADELIDESMSDYPNSKALAALK